MLSDSDPGCQEGPQDCAPRKMHRCYIDRETPIGMPKDSSAAVSEQLRIVKQSMLTVEKGLLDGSLSPQAEIAFAQMLSALANSLLLHANNKSNQ